MIHYRVASRVLTSGLDVVVADRASPAAADQLLQTLRVVVLQTLWLRHLLRWMPLILRLRLLVLPVLRLLWELVGSSASSSLMVRRRWRRRLLLLHCRLRLLLVPPVVRLPRELL